jgi:hypothetical protein
MRGDVLADVPIIGVAFKVMKAIDTIRDRAFAAKLVAFVKSLEAISAEDRERLKAKVAGYPEEATKLGETLFLVLERVTDLEKPVLLAQLFIAYVDNVITAAELRRLAQALDAAFVDDVAKLLAFHRTPEKSDAPGWMQYLAPSGLTRALAAATWDDSGKLFYEVSALGHKFRTACFHSRKKQNLFKA